MRGRSGFVLRAQPYGQQVVVQIEALDDVERCFVHVDYQTRDEPEHKVERGLSLKAAADLSKAAAAGGSGEHTTQLQDLREV